MYEFNSNWKIFLGLVSMEYLFYCLYYVVYLGLILVLWYIIVYVGLLFNLGVFG